MFYEIPVFWSMYDNLVIEADSLEEAIELARVAPLSVGTYIDDSFEVSEDILAEEYSDDPPPSILSESL
jgi:hypothetical protein